MNSTSTHALTTGSRNILDPAEGEQPLPVHVRIAVERILSDAYSLWGLCTKSACRRARCCKGAARECLDAWVPLLAPDVADGGLRMLEGQMNGLSFDELYARHPDEIMALAHWRGHTERRAASPRRRDV